MTNGKEKSHGSLATGDSSGSHGSTLFVSNLPYHTTAQSLEAFFSEIAPVRHCFVVTRKDPLTGKAQSKGVGYVSFAIKEDAASVITLHEKEKMVIDGRAVRLEYAARKDPSDVRAEKVEKADIKPIPAASVFRDKAASRTIVILISSPSADMSQKTLWKKIRKYKGAQSVNYPVETLPDSSQTSLAHATFETALQAQDAAKKLHAHVWKGALLSAIVKKKADEFGKKGKGGTNARLIIRNLPNDITEDDLKCLFIPHAPIYSVHMPSASSDRKPRFAFVQLYTKEDAEKALTCVNGIRVVAGVSSRVRPKDAADKPLEADPAKVGGIDDDTKMDIDGEKKHKGRIVAVDWAINKTEWERAQKNGGVGPSHEQSEEDEDADSHGGNAEATDSNESEASAASTEDDSDAHSEASESETGASTHGGDKGHDPPLPATVSDGTTLFVRNLAFEATDEDLMGLFKAFGPLRYCRVTTDPETGRSRGSGFVRFRDQASADAALEEAKKVTSSLSLSGNASRTASHSLLTPDPSSSLTASLVLMGRTLNVTRAVSRDEANHLRDTATKQQEKKDARNLYLLREGVIFADTPAASTIPPQELKRRLQAYDERRASLRSNPLLFISRTRLSVRNLPQWVTDRCLKNLAAHAVREFKHEVKEGVREDLSREEYEVDSISAAEPDSQSSQAPTPKQKTKGRFSKASTVKQAKVARSADRVDPFSPTGAGKSNGFGFLELEKHTDALRVLRWANNRSGLTELMRDWWKSELGANIARAKQLPGQKQGAQGPGTRPHHAMSEEDARKARLQLWERTWKDMEAEDKAGPRTKSKPLLVEFAIENRSMLKKRAEKMRRMQAPKQEASKADVLGAKRRRAEGAEDVNAVVKRIKVQTGLKSNQT